MAPEQSHELKIILETLPKGWKLKRLGPGRTNWVADLTYRNMHFSLVCDKGYISAHKIVDGNMETIEPPDDQRIAITPQQVRDLLVAATQ